MNDTNENADKLHAISIFEKRNRAFRVLYDTVLEATQTTDTSEIYAILGRNLRHISNATMAGIASYDKNTKQLTLQSISLTGEDIASDSSLLCNRTVITEEVETNLKRDPIQKCLREVACLTSLLPDSALGTIDYLSNNRKCYSFSFSHMNELLALGFIQMPDDCKLKMKDMVDTYLGLASVIIQRSNAIYELQKSNDRFQTFIDNSPMGIIVVDKKQTIVEVNNAALQIVQQNRSDIIGKKCTSVICMSVDDECPMKNKSIIDREEREAIRADGSVVPILKSVAPIEIEGESYLLETFIDITDQKRAEEEKNKLQQQLFLGQKLEAIGTLATGIAHEINTPLQFIGDNTRYVLKGIDKIFSLLEQYHSLTTDLQAGVDVTHKMAEISRTSESIKLDYLKKDLPDAVKETLEGISHASKIVKAMHSFSFVGEDQRAFADINKAIENTIMISRNSWKKYTAVETHFDNNLPAVNCYISEINQVIMNLLINATHSIQEKFEKDNQKGSITITTSKDNNNILITIKDTGAGIPDDIKQKIFEPFFTTKQVGHGTGQGLSISYSTIVEKHKGTIDFDSEIDKGTTFYIHLPIQ